MFCPQCGKQPVAEGNRYCQFCGAEVGETSVAPPLPPSSMPQMPPSPPPLKVPARPAGINNPAPPPPRRQGPAKIGSGMAAGIFVGLAVVLVVVLHSLKTVLGVLIIAGLVLWWFSRSGGGSSTPDSEMESVPATQDTDVRTEESPHPDMTEGITVNGDPGPLSDDSGTGSEPGPSGKED